MWDAWRNEDGRWTVQLHWKAGRSDNLAHFRFCPGAHEAPSPLSMMSAKELVDPDFDRPLRPVAPVAQLDSTSLHPHRPETPTAKPKSEPTRSRRGKPPVPAWEDVLLGVRSGGQR